MSSKTSEMMRIEDAMQRCAVWWQACRKWTTLRGKGSDMDEEGSSRESGNYCCCSADGMTV